jgi:tetratricopeptide (TPR) repeat protein
LAIRQWLATRDPVDAVSQNDLSVSYSKLGAALDGAKDFSGALTNYRAALKILENGSKDNRDELARDRLAGAYYHVAIASVETGNLDEALKNAAQAISIRESIRSADHARDTLIRTHLAGDYGSMAQILSTKGELASAVINQQKAVTLLTSLATQNPNDQTIRSFRGQAEFYLGVTLERYGRLDQALSNCQQSMKIFESLLAADPNNAFAEQYLGLTNEVMGRLEVSKGQPRLALQRFEKAIEIFERLRTKDPKTPATLVGFGESYMGMGRANLALARNSRTQVGRVQYLRQARAWYQKSLSVWEELRSLNALDPLDKNKPEEAAKGIAECDAALAKLGVLSD